MSRKNLALEKIESHEKLCRIMQKQTHQKISSIENDIKVMGFSWPIRSILASD